MRYTELLYCHFSGSAISHEEIYAQDSAGEKWSPAGALEEYQLAQSENDRSHRSGIDCEKELLAAVKNGDTAAMKALMGGATPDFGDIGEVAQERNKEYEYMMVVIIALMTRTAIGGIVMTDWIIAGYENERDCIHPVSDASHVCMAGGDLFMPGSRHAYDSIKAGLEKGTVTKQQLQINATRVLHMAGQLCK